MGPLYHCQASLPHSWKERMEGGLEISYHHSATLCCPRLAMDTNAPTLSGAYRCILLINNVGSNDSKQGSYTEEQICHPIRMKGFYYLPRENGCTRGGRQMGSMNGSCWGILEAEICSLFCWISPFHCTTSSLKGEHLKLTSLPFEGRVGSPWLSPRQWLGHHSCLCPP